MGVNRHVVDNPRRLVLLGRVKVIPMWTDDAPREPRRPQGECEVCGRLMRLRRDGSVYGHQPPEAVGRWPVSRVHRCPGSERPPRGKDEDGG